MGRKDFNSTKKSLRQSLSLEHGVTCKHAFEMRLLNMTWLFTTLLIILNIVFSGLTFVKILLLECHLPPDISSAGDFSDIRPPRIHSAEFGRPRATIYFSYFR